MYSGSYTRHDISDKVLTEGAGEWDAANVATLGAEVRVRKIVKHHKPHEEEGENEWYRCEDETEFLCLVPFTDGDVRDKDKGG